MSNLPPNTWPKGKSGNPKGRPKKGTSVSELLAALGLEVIVKTSDGKTISRKEAMANMLWQKALKEGDVTAMKVILDRTEGRVAQVVQGPDDPDGNPTPAAVINVIQKRSMEEWNKTYTPPSSSGNPNQDKPKPSPAQPLKPSSVARKVAGKATSSSATSSRTTKSGAKPGKASSSVARTKNSKK